MAHIQSIQTFQNFNENIERHIIPSGKAQPETKIKKTRSYFSLNNTDL